MTVPAGTFNCKVQTLLSDAGGTKSTSKIYLSDEVPGGVVKSESTIEGAMASKSVTELVNIEKPYRRAFGTEQCPVVQQSHAGRATVQTSNIV